MSIPLFVFEVKLLFPLNVSTAELPLDHIGHEQNETLEEVKFVVELPFNERPFPVAFERLEFASNKFPPPIEIQSLLEFVRELPFTDTLPLLI
jgi:hypothetical protein